MKQVHVQLKTHRAAKVRHFCPGPLSISPWPMLRKTWFKRLCDSQHWLRLVAHIKKGDPRAPLSTTELQPYMDDLLSAFQVHENVDSVCQIPPGQPFRLKLEDFSLVLAG